MMPWSVFTGISSIANRRSRCRRLSASLAHRRAELRADLGIARVDVERLAGFRIDEAHQPDVGQNALARIFERHRDDVVPLREQLERLLDVVAKEVRYEKDDRLVREHLVEVLGRAADVGAARSRARTPGCRE